MLTKPLLLVACIFVQPLYAQAQRATPIIPTSVALDVAEMVARDEGYKVPNEKLFFFDQSTTKDGRPLFPGYITMSFFGNGHPINQISINEQTGQVVDTMICAIFEYPDVEKFGKDVRRTSGAKPASVNELEDEVGCDKMKELGRPTSSK